MTDQAVIVPPIVVAEGWDLTFFRSKTDLLSQLEPWYSNEEYRAFDSQGLRLELFAEPPVRPQRLIGPISTDNSHVSSLSVRPIETASSGHDELAALLREWLPRLGAAPQDLDGVSLDELLLKSIERVGFIPRKPRRRVRDALASFASRFARPS